MLKPNFFIIGAPKCGTTALSEYLRTHPNIYISSPKEPHYFAEDLGHYCWAKSLDQYLKLFEDSRDNHLAVGEGSVLYLYSSVAIRNIYHFNPDAKIIVMLRNPIELIYSYHSQAVYCADEDEKEFEKAWKLQSLRRKGFKIPRACRHPKLLQYAEVGRLGEQIERLLSIFPSQQIYVIFFEDFTTSTRQVYENVLAFLGVPSDERVNFPKINANKIHRVTWLGNFTEKTPLPLVEIAMNTKKLLGLQKLDILDRIRRFNVKVSEREPLSPSFRAELIDEFREDLKKLSFLLGKDLSHWIV
jgi:hypothetical protein